MVVPIMPSDWHDHPDRSARGSWRHYFNKDIIGHSISVCIGAFCPWYFMDIVFSERLSQGYWSGHRCGYQYLVLFNACCLLTPVSSRAFAESIRVESDAP